MRGHKYDTDPLRDPVTGKLDHAELRRRLKGWLAVAVAFTVLFGGLGFGTYKAYDAYTTAKYAHDFPGTGNGKDVVVQIPEKSSAKTIGKLLADAGVIKEASEFSKAASTRPDQYGQVQAGKYRLTQQIPAKMALAQLIDPARAMRVMVQLPEGMRLSQSVQRISDVSKVPVAQINAYLARTTPASMGLPLYVPTYDQLNQAKQGNLNVAEGFVFPDTYEVPDNVGAGTVLNKAIAQFNKTAQKIDLMNLAETLDFGKDAAAAKNKKYSAVIVASIIQREVSRPADMPKVARVIYNRLAAGQKLQMDSTTAYAVNKTGTIWTTEADRAAPSPYNTYYAPALPPGPIASPGEAALTAALHPADGDWLYFQPINLETGETVFSKDQATHDQAVTQLSQWCASAPETYKARCGK